MKQSIETLKSNLALHKDRISKFRDMIDHMNESTTKSTVIGPILGSLGWDIEDPFECRMEYRHDHHGTKDNPVDYALFLNSRAAVMVEAKSLKVGINTSALVQALNYASSGGAQWCVVTDGSRWVLLDTKSHGDLAEKTLFDVCIDNDDLEEVAISLYHLNRSSIESGSVAKVARMTNLDRRMRVYLEDYVSPIRVAISFIRDNPDIDHKDAMEAISRIGVRIGGATTLQASHSLIDETSDLHIQKMYVTIPNSEFSSKLANIVRARYIAKHPHKHSYHGCKTWVANELTKNGQKTTPETVRKWMNNKTRPRPNATKLLSEILRFNLHDMSMY